MSVNPFATHVTVHLDEPRKMRFTMNSIAEAEALVGCTIILDGSEQNVFKQLKAGRGNIRFIRALLWAGLVPDNPEITVDEAGELITIDRLKEIQDGINKALRLFFQRQGHPLPEPRALAAAPLEEKVVEMPAADGSTSGASPATISA